MRDEQVGRPSFMNSRMACKEPKRKFEKYFQKKMWAHASSTEGCESEEHTWVLTLLDMCSVRTLLPWISASPTKRPSPKSLPSCRFGRNCKKKRTACACWMEQHCKVAWSNISSMLGWTELQYLFCIGCFYTFFTEINQNPSIQFIITDI